MSETPKRGFVASRPIYFVSLYSKHCVDPDQTAPNGHYRPSSNNYHSFLSHAAEKNCLAMVLHGWKFSGFSIESQPQNNELGRLGYYIGYRSLYRHVVCNGPVSLKANKDRNQSGV